LTIENRATAVVVGAVGSVGSRDWSSGSRPAWRGLLWSWVKVVSHGSALLRRMVAGATGAARIVSARRTEKSNAHLPDPKGFGKPLGSSSVQGDCPMPMGSPSDRISGVVPERPGVAGYGQAGAGAAHDWAVWPVVPGTGVDQCQSGRRILARHRRGSGTVLRVRPRLRQGKPGLVLARHVLGEAVFQHRSQLLTRPIQVLLAMSPQQRSHARREEPGTYQSTPEHDATLDVLLQNVPFPDLDNT